MLVSQILKSKSGDGIVTVAPEASVSDAAKLLASKRIGAVVVSSDGKKAAGILSERDIVRELAKAGPEEANNLWPSYTKRWQRWNHIRTFVGVLSIALLSFGIANT